MATRKSNIIGTLAPPSMPMQPKANANLVALNLLVKEILNIF